MLQTDPRPRTELLILKGVRGPCLTEERKVSHSAVHNTISSRSGNGSTHLKWKKRHDETNEPHNTTTLIECIVDFELTMGMRLEDISGEKLSWSQKAERLAYYIVTLVMANTMKWHATEVTYRQAIRPTSNATSLTPLGAPLMSGFARKPLWCDGRTPGATAINIWKARQETLTNFPNIGIAEWRSREFAKRWALNLRGYPTKNKEQKKQRGNKATEDVRSQLDREEGQDGQEARKDAKIEAAPATGLSSTEGAKRKNTGVKQSKCGKTRKESAHDGAMGSPVTPPSCIPVQAVAVGSKKQSQSNMLFNEHHKKTKKDNDERWLLDPHIPLPSITRS